MQVLTIRLAASINAFTMVSLPYWLSRPPTVTMTRVGDSKSVTAISEEEEISNSQGAQEGQLQSPDPSDGDPTGHSMDEAFWLKDADRTGDSTTEPVWLSLPITGAGRDIFKDLLDPALFDSEAPPSQPFSCSSPQDTDATPD
jgi:hypothetical protein